MRKSRKNNKRNNNYQTKQVNAATASQKIPGPEEVQAGDIPIKDLLFRPLIYKSGSDSVVEFDHIKVPFLIKDNLVFMILFMGGCGGTSAYTECYEMDPEKPSNSYRDAIPLMKECLEIEQLTGIEYYFGKLDKGLERYLYAMQLFIDKKITTKEHVIEIIKELGIESERMEEASQSVACKIAEEKMSMSQMRGEARTRAAAGEIILKFLSDILSGEDNNTETNDMEE